MKAVALLLVTLCSISSFAGQVKFKNDSVLTESLKTLIEQTIVEECPYLKRRAWPVVESRTETYANPPDTMVADLHYKTVFTVMAEDNDGMHPYTFGMVVESVTESVYKAEAATNKVLSIDARDACRYTAE